MTIQTMYHSTTASHKGKRPQHPQAWDLRSITSKIIRDRQGGDARSAVSLLVAEYVCMFLADVDGCGSSKMLESGRKIHIADIAPAEIYNLIERRFGFMSIIGDYCRLILLRFFNHHVSLLCIITYIMKLNVC